MAQKMTGARLFAHTLKAFGVSHVFFMDAVLRRCLAELPAVIDVKTEFGAQASLPWVPS